ncbi:MAG: Txe/YoeB family addiction module toxin [Propionibacteriaceae bacterium]|nr:Txe/YoeB family addiction module toxin [Propionibacteriaceae bacterium]
MVNVLFDDAAWEDYTSWLRDNRRMVEKINKLLADIDRHPEEGAGHPEPLRGDWSGYWSRRISNADRLIYQVVDDVIRVAQCRGHYDDH